MKKIIILLGIVWALNLSANTFSKGQVWKGWYNCKQGKTSLDLIIEKVHENDMKAIFSFNYAGTKKGKFEMYGTYNPKDKSLDLVPGEWIKKPRGYSSISMSGKVYMGDTYVGKINYPSCSNFELKKVR